VTASTVTCKWCDDFLRINTARKDEIKANKNRRFRHTQTDVFTVQTRSSMQWHTKSVGRFFSWIVSRRHSDCSRSHPWMNRPGRAVSRASVKHWAATAEPEKKREKETTAMRRRVFFDCLEDMQERQECAAKRSIHSVRCWRIRN